MSANCIVLAGGKSKRLGRNKVAEKIGQLSLIEHVVLGLTEFHTEIIVVVAADSKIPSLKGYSGVHIVEDIIPGKGTLGGIYTGLKLSQSPVNIVVACDMPFLNFKLLNYMLGYSNENDIVVPRTGAMKLEPLHAIYNRRCLEPIEFLLEQNRLSVLGLFPMVKVKYIEESEIVPFDPMGLSFFNINTDLDLQAGKQLAGNGESNINDKC